MCLFSINLLKLPLNPAYYNELTWYYSLTGHPDEQWDVH